MPGSVVLEDGVMQLPGWVVPHRPQEAEEEQRDMDKECVPLCLSSCSCQSCFSIELFFINLYRCVEDFINITLFHCDKNGHIMIDH